MVRIKERYLLVKLIYPPDIGSKGASKVSNHVVEHQPTIERLTPQLLMAAIFQSVGLLFGDYGRGAVSGHASIKYLSLATSTFIMRCAREHHKMVWAALTLLRKVPVEGGRPCMFHVVRVSGTMRKVEEEAIRQARRLILAAQNDDTSTFLSVFTDESRNEELEDVTMQDDNGDSDDGVANVAG